MPKQRKNRDPYPYGCKTTSSAYKSRTDPPMYFVKGYFDGREPEDVIIEDGIEYERTDHIPIDLNSIPDHVRKDLGRAIYEAFHEFMRRPDAEAILEASKERLRSEGSTLLDR